MSGGFVKLYGTILDSSIWLESSDTRIVWITLLAMADQHGMVQASVGGLGHRANVARANTVAAIKRLGEPDPDDRSGVEEGRRIVPIRGGWHIVNYKSYRELRTEQQVKEAHRKAVQRDKSRDKKGQPRQSRVSHAEAEAEYRSRTTPAKDVVPRDIQPSDAGDDRRPDRSRSRHKTAPAKLGALLPAVLANVQADTRHADAQATAWLDQRPSEGLSR